MKKNNFGAFFLGHSRPGAPNCSGLVHDNGTHTPKATLDRANLCMLGDASMMGYPILRIMQGKPSLSVDETYFEWVSNGW